MSSFSQAFVPTVGYFPVQRTDRLRLEMRTSHAADAAFVDVQMVVWIQDDNTLEITPHVLTIKSWTSDREPNEVFSNNPGLGIEGRVIGLYVDNSGTVGLKRGELYVQAYIRHRKVRTTSQVPLCAGYVYGIAFTSLSLGQYIEPGPGGGEGAIRSIDLGDPAAGADYTSQTVPSNAMWRPLAAFGQFVTAVAAANRFPGVIVTDGTNVVAHWRAPTAQVASTTTNYAWMRNQPNESVNAGAANTGKINIPDLLLPEAFVLDFDTTNIQAADDWGDGQLLVEEWLIP